MFADEKLQLDFEKNGFVVVPFLSSNELAAVVAYYESVKHLHEITSPVHSTSDTNNAELIESVDKKLKQLTWQAQERFFYEHNCFLSNFLIKESGEDSAIYPHQDWTFVDEEKYASASVWCPLTDVNETTGFISVLPGSHNLSKNIRSSPDSPSAFKNVATLVEENILPLKIKSGEALIYHHGIVHCSSLNLSGKPRPVLVLAVVPKEAKIFMYYYHPAPAERKLERFIVNTDFFYSYNKYSRPNGKYSIGFVDTSFETLSVEKFCKAFNLPLPSQKESIAPDSSGYLS